MTDWLGCEHPERPYDMSIRWHLIQRCRACSVRYQVDRLHMKPEHRAIMDELL